MSDILRPDMVLTDRRGVDWRRTEGYQEGDTSAPGWLLIRSDKGEVMPFPEALEAYGTIGPPDPCAPWKPSGPVFLVRHEEAP